MLEDFHIVAATMPDTKRDAAFAASMLHVFGAGDKIGDTAEADSDEGDKCPDTREKRKRLSQPFRSFIHPFMVCLFIECFPKGERGPFLKEKEGRLKEEKGGGGGRAY